MEIKLKELSDSVFKNFLGGDKEFSAKMFIDENVKIMLGTLIPGASIGLHTHTSNFEVIYVLKGEGKMQFEDGFETLKVGDCHYCKKGKAHSFKNEKDTDLVFFAVVPLKV